MDEKVYTCEQVLAALSSLQNQYYNEQLNVLMKGVPQLVERLRECEASFHTATDSTRDIRDHSEACSYCLDHAQHLSDMGELALRLREHGGGSD